MVLEPWKLLNGLSNVTAVPQLGGNSWDQQPRSSLCRRLDDDCEVSQELCVELALGVSDKKQNLHEDGFTVGENHSSSSGCRGIV